MFKMFRIICILYFYSTNIEYPIAQGDHNDKEQQTNLIAFESNGIKGIFDQINF